MDSYLAISAIAQDSFMNDRMTACVTQQEHLGNAQSITYDPVNKPPAYAAKVWVEQNAYLWASSPGWGEAWEYALNSNPDATPGSDETVITDGMILASVQALTNPQPPAEE